MAVCAAGVVKNSAVVVPSGMIHTPVLNDWTCASPDVVKKGIHRYSSALSNQHNRNDRNRAEVHRHGGAAANRMKPQSVL
jgi:hypothetical protein